MTFSPVPSTPVFTARIPQECAEHGRWWFMGNVYSAPLGIRPVCGCLWWTHPKVTPSPMSQSCSILFLFSFLWGLVWGGGGSGGAGESCPVESHSFEWQQNL